MFERWIDELKPILDEIADLDREGGLEERIRVNALVVGAVDAKAKL